MSKIRLTESQFYAMITEYAVHAKDKYQYMRLGQALIAMLKRDVSPEHVDADIFFQRNDRVALDDFLEKYVEEELE